AVSGLAVVQGTPEVVCRPGADAGVLVRRDVRPVQGTEGRRYGAAAGIGLAATRGMAGHAVARLSQVGAPLNQLWVGKVAGGGRHEGIVAGAEPVAQPKQQKRQGDDDGQPETQPAAGTARFLYGAHGVSPADATGC